MNALSCPGCGAEIAPDSPAGLCPRCLMRTGLEHDSDAIADSGATTPHPPGSGSARRFVPPTPQQLAEHFPQLEILGLIGAGGMGAVYKARQKDLDRVVALKVLPPQLGEDPAFSERFTREARAMARLSHPNIVAIFDFGRAGELYYFTMEFVDGTNLRQVIKTERVQSSDALGITAQICDALQYAHDEGVLHRDIKPENILVSKLGRVKITDFGLAKIVLDAAQECSLTATRELLGTFRYMAPEQLEGSKVVDHRADIYAVGIVLYELLTGEVPMGRFQSPSEKTKSDPRLDAVVLKALEQSPERRYQSAGEMKAALGSLDAAADSLDELSTFTSRWTSGMWSGIWSTATSRPASGWVVACRLLGMLVAFAGLTMACFLVWESARVELLEPPPDWPSYSTTIAHQTSLGWQTLPGKLVAVAFGLIVLHVLSNLHRLRWLRPTFGAFFVCGFAVVALSAWSLAREPVLSDGPIRWENSAWQDLLRNSSTPQDAVPKTPRAYLESLAADANEAVGRQLESLTHLKLIELLERRGKVYISGSYGTDGPYAALSLAIALAFVGLLEFVFVYAAEPARRLFGSARSSVGSRLSGRAAVGEPRISKMAVGAALLGLLPIIPLIFLGMMGFHAMRGGGVEGEAVAVAIGFLVGLSVFPTTVGLFALYRIRRYRGLLHGLPLAFAASITWPLIIIDVLVYSIVYTLSGRHEPGLLVVAIVFNVLAYALGWLAVKKPLEVVPRSS